MRNMRSETVDELVVNVDLKPVPKLAFEIQLTWCID
jgi:hypothetical protein